MEKDFDLGLCNNNLNKATERLADEDSGVRGSGMTYLLYMMSPELLEEDECLYQKGLELTLKHLNDNEPLIRRCAVIVLFKVMNDTTQNELYTRFNSHAFNGIEQATHDREKIVRVTARNILKEKMKNNKKRIITKRY